MKIAHVLASFEVGGGESVALGLAGRQRKNGHAVLVVSLASLGGPMAERFRSSDVQTYTVAKRSGFDATLFPRLWAFFLHQRVQMVHTHNPQALVYAAPAARLARLPVVHTKHGEGADLGRRIWLRRRAASLLNAFISVSRETDRYARANEEAPEAIMEVIENGVDLSRFSPDEKKRSEIRAELGIPNAARVIGTVGRLEAVKNQALLLRAAAPLLGPEVRLVLVGDGPKREELERLAGELGRREAVHFLGQRSDVAAVLTGLDLFVLSSRTEGLPMVLIEAMATTLPIISTAVGGIPDLIEEGETGLLVPEGDERLLRENLTRLLGDENLCRQMGGAGREVALAGYSVERMEGRYMELYRRLMGP